MNNTEYCTGSTQANESESLVWILADSVFNSGQMVEVMMDVVLISDIQGNVDRHFVYIHPNDVYDCTGFFQCCFHNPNIVVIEKCSQVPEGTIQALVTQITQIHFLYKHPCHENKSLSPSDVYNNYVKDCLAHERYGLSYVDYMYNIIDNLISLNTSHENDTDPDKLDTDSKRGHGVGDVDALYNVPNGISAHITECVNPVLGVHSDVVITNNHRGFLNH